MARAANNFSISGTPISVTLDLIHAMTFVKTATIRTNARLGVLDSKFDNTIKQACVDLVTGWHHSIFKIGRALLQDPVLMTLGQEFYWPKR